MRDDETGEVTATTILTGVYLDTQARKSCPLPENVRGRAQRMVEQGTEQTQE